MDIMPPPSKELHLISSYGGSRFVVRGEAYAHHLLIWPEGVAYVALDSISNLTSLNLVDYMPSLPELLIVGTGTSMSALTTDLKKDLSRQKVKFDQMDTGAACRTYNVLASEDRKIAALLMLI